MTHPGSQAARRIIGLTGGIATGKTTVAQYLASAYQLPSLDADRYARDAVAPGTRALTQIVDRYGPEILLADGQLNRSQLGSIVFKSTSERLWLEAQIHPYVRQHLQAEASLSQQAILVLVVPLLFEAKMTDLVSEIWVVHCSPAQQIERLRQRNGLSLKQAQARIDTQMPLAEKVARATVVLDNSSTAAALFKQIDRALGQPTQQSSLHGQGDV